MFDLTISKIILFSSLAESNDFVVSEDKVTQCYSGVGDSGCSPRMNCVQVQQTSANQTVYKACPTERSDFHYQLFERAFHEACQRRTLKFLL
jgi:hypothetical protein